jgi:hypothetical protein
MFNKIVAVVILYGLLISSENVSTISNQTSSEIINNINELRKKYNLPLVSWSQPLTNDLESWASKIGVNWFFEMGPGSGPGVGGSNTSYNGYHLMSMKPFNKTYPGYKFLIHDTLTDPNKLFFIINFRLHQLFCIKWSKCSSKIFTNFETCGNPLVLRPHLSCSWATQYLPRLMIRSLTGIAGVVFHEHGPFAPAAQRWSFFFYGKYDNLTSDRPF